MTEPYFETPNGKLYHGDCFEIMREFPDESVDLVLTDPPYGINFKSNYRKKKKFDYIKNDNNLLWFEDFYDESMRILKNDSFMYSFFRFDSLCEVITLFGTKVKPFNVLVWDKVNLYGMGDLSYWANCYEIVLVYKKGNPILKNFDKRPRSVMYYQIVNGNDMIHPTEKPVELCREIIKYSSDVGQVVFDPFAGSGSTLVAANDLQRQWCGIELSEEYCKTIKNRLSQTKLFEYNTPTLEALCKAK